MVNKKALVAVAVGGVAVAAAVALAAQAASGPAGPVGGFVVTVQSLSTRAPIQGARVQVLVSPKVFADGTTDANGVFDTKLTVPAPATYEINISAQGYYPSSLIQSTIANQDIQLPPVLLGPVVAGTPIITVTPNLVAPGGSFSFSGQFWTPGATITLSAVFGVGVSPFPFSFGTVAADANGNIGGNRTVPANVPAGAVTLTATEAGSGKTSTFSFTVL